jgi:hypothetical protein
MKHIRQRSCIAAGDIRLHMVEFAHSRDNGADILII